MCIPQPTHKIHKVHSLQVYNLLAKAPVEIFPYKVYIWEKYYIT